MRVGKEKASRSMDAGKAAAKSKDGRKVTRAMRDAEVETGHASPGNNPGGMRIMRMDREILTVINGITGVAANGKMGSRWRMKNRAPIVAVAGYHIINHEQ